MFATFITDDSPQELLATGKSDAARSMRVKFLEKRIHGQARHSEEAVELVICGVKSQVEHLTRNHAL